MADGAAPAPGDPPERRPPGERWPLNTGRGLAMGLADAVPGVSGGTIALLLGIHPRLVTAIRAFDRAFLRALLVDPRDRAARRSLGRRLQAMDTPFLLLLGLGIGIGAWLGFSLFVGLMERHPTTTAAFFFGLILASVRVPWRMMPTRGLPEAAAFLAAAGLAAWVTLLDPVHAPAAWWFLPVAGAIAICAMILPGISGAFLLVLMGLYQEIGAAVRSLHLPTLLLFGAGALVGILAFSRVLHRLFSARPGPTLAALAGLMIGSLGRVWPFKAGGERFIDGANVLPALGPHVAAALAAALAGALVVLALERTCIAPGRILDRPDRS